MATRRGDFAKQFVTEEIVKAFEDNFVTVQDKKIYLNVKEGAETVQVAISLTVPKTPIGASDGNTIINSSSYSPTELSDEDKQAIEGLKKKLGIY